MRFRVGTHFDYYTLTSLKEMKHRVKVLIALSLLCCGLKLQAQEHIDYYNVDFSEGIPTEMLTYDLDGQTLHYTMIQAGFKQGQAWIDKREDKSENRYAASACRYKEIEGETLDASDDWLVMPAVWVRDEDATLSWRGASISAKLGTASGYKVCISTVGDKPEDFFSVPVFETTEESINSWTQHSLSLKDYVGQRIYIAFVNNSTTGEILGIDDIEVTGSKGLCDLVVDSDRYIFEHNDLTIKGYVEACSDEVITDVTIKCISSEGEVEASYGSLALSRGEKFTFELPNVLRIDYGQTLHYQVIAVINNVVTTDPISCTATALMHKLHKNIVVEEATGMWCAYCPSGIVAMEELEKKYPDTFIGLALHYNDQLGVDDYVMDLSFPDGFPTGWINRKHYTIPMVETEQDGKVVYTTLNGGFETYFIQEMQVPAIADVRLSSSELVGGAIDVSAEISFAANINQANMRVAYVIVENNVSDPNYFQVNGYSGKDVEIGGFEDLSKEIHDIKFQHVVRGIYDDWQGVEGSVPTKIDAGETYIHNYSIALPTTIKNIAETEVVCMLIDITTGEIINAAKMSIPTSVEEIIENSIECRYSAGEIIISVQDSAEIIVYDVAGSEVMRKNAINGRVDVETLSTGLYVAKIICNDMVQTLKFVVR